MNVQIACYFLIYTIMLDKKSHKQFKRSNNTGYISFIFTRILDSLLLPQLSLGNPSNVLIIRNTIIPFIIVSYKPKKIGRLIK